MKWTVFPIDPALRDASRLFAGMNADRRAEAEAEFVAALHALKDDPRRNTEIVPGDNRWLRVFDFGRTRLLANLNVLHVSDPDDDRICWVVGVLRMSRD